MIVAYWSFSWRWRRWWWWFRRILEMTLMIKFCTYFVNGAVERRFSGQFYIIIKLNVCWFKKSNVGRRIQFFY
ncbi:hypothetical protein POPTR_003G009650v4 [Populus trichocarpa]|uniref:Uncharacterized protein n=1 Tax=Populus trichocarpa TaxID=3694 RepID=A0A3N7FL43_POPTR|nr:hypothetical protein POPTR_003G009650v4 [Populus trichocarpa]